MLNCFKLTLSLSLFPSPTLTNYGTSFFNKNFQRKNATVHQVNPSRSTRLVWTRTSHAASWKSQRCSPGAWPNNARNHRFFGGGTHGFWWRCSQPTHWYPPGQFLWIPSHRRVYVIFVGDGTPSTTLISDTSIHRSHSHEICLQAFSLGICKRYDGAAFSQNLRKTAVHLIV